MRLVPRPWWGKILVAGAGVGLLILGGFWYLTSAGFWEWLGWRLVAAVQDRLKAELQVESVTGDLVTGMVFRNIKVQRQEEIITLAELEVSLSLWSLLRLEPVLGTVALRHPVVTLRQDPSGVWNIADLLKKRPPPPFDRLHLQRLAVEKGTLRVVWAGRVEEVQEIDLELQLTINKPGRPEASYNIPALQLAASRPPWPRIHLAGGLNLTAETLELTQLQLGWDGTTVAQLEGQLGQLRQQLTAALRARILPVAQEVLRQFWPRWPQGLTFQGEFTMNGPPAALDLKGQGALNDAPWSVAGRWQEDPGKEFWLLVDWSQVSGPLLRQITGLAAAELGLSPLSGRLELTGSDYPWQGKLQSLKLELEPFTYRQAKVSTAKLLLDLSRPQEEEGSLWLQGNFGSLTAKLRGRFLPRPAWPSWCTGTVALQLQNLQPHLLTVFWPPAASLSGDLSGTFRLSPQDLSQAQVDGRVQLSGRYQEWVVERLTVEGNWTGQRLQIRDSRLALAGGSQVTAAGWLDRRGLDLSIGLAGRLPLPGLKLTAAGRGQLQGRAWLRGPWAALTANLELSGDRVGWQQFQAASLRAQLQGQWRQGRLALAQIDAKLADLKTPWGPWPLLALQGQGRDLGLDFQLTGHLSPERQGRLRGFLAWEKAACRLRLDEGRWPLGGQELKLTQPADLSLSPGLVALTPLHLQWGPGRLTLQGQIGAEQLAFQVQVADLPLEQLPKTWLPLPVSGRFNLELTGSGTPSAPHLTGKVNLSPGRLADLSFAVCRGTIVYQGRTALLQAELEEKPGGVRLALQGQVPLFLSLRPWRWQVLEEELQLRLTSDRLDLNLLPAVTPQVSQATGPVQLALQVRGTWQQPQVAGSLRWEAATLKLKASGALLHLDPGAIKLTSDRLELPPVLIRSGTGQARLQGEARVVGFLPQAAALTLQLTDAQIINRDGSQAAVSGQVQLSGSWPVFQLQGRLTATSGQFRLGFFQSTQRQDIIILPRDCRYPLQGQEPGRFQAGAVAHNFSLKILIDIPGNVWLRDKEVKAEIEGQMSLNRQPGQPFYLGGALRAKQGSLLMANKVFNLEQATLSFPNGPHKPTLLEARASRMVDDIRLTLVASGPVANLRTRVESTPPLPPRDILSLMVFDRVAGKMTRDEYLTVSQRAMGLIGGFTMERLKDLLGGALPLVGEVSPASSQNGVGVGKKLGKDITLSYERKLNPLQGEDINQIRLNYKIHKYFSAETQLGRRNPGGDLFFNLDF